MKKSRFTDNQIIETIKRVEAGVSVPEICQELNISSATFYKWCAKYGGMDVSMMGWMKELEAENARLKRCISRKNSRQKSIAEALEKSGEAISPPRNGQACCAGA